MSEWGDKLASINDAYLILDNKSAQLIGLIEADNGRYDMQIATKMMSLGYGIIRLNFDDLVADGNKFKQKLQVQNATQQLMEGL